MKTYLNNTRQFIFLLTLIFTTACTTAPGGSQFSEFPLDSNRQDNAAPQVLQAHGIIPQIIIVPTEEEEDLEDPLAVYEWFLYMVDNKYDKEAEEGFFEAAATTNDEIVKSFVKADSKVYELEAQIKNPSPRELEQIQREFNQCRKEIGSKKGQCKRRKQKQIAEIKKAHGESPEAKKQLKALEEKTDEELKKLTAELQQAQRDCAKAKQEIQQKPKRELRKARMERFIAKHVLWRHAKQQVHNAN